MWNENAKSSHFFLGPFKNMEKIRLDIAAGKNQEFQKVVFGIQSGHGFAQFSCLR